MKLYSVLRVQKISQSSETAAHNHNLRASLSKHETNVNYNLTKNNELLIGGRETIKIINSKINDLKLNKAIRKDANRAIEIVLSASPEYFYNFDKSGISREEWDELIPSNYEGRMDLYWKKISAIKNNINHENYEAWKANTINWVKNEFGNSIVNLVLHVDEKSPHMHLIVVPIHKGRLSAKEFFTPYSATRWQTEYSKATKLNRGISSDKKHKDKISKSFYDSKIKGYQDGYLEGKKTAFSKSKKIGFHIGSFINSAKTIIRNNKAIEEVKRIKLEAEKAIRFEQNKQKVEIEKLISKSEMQLQFEREKTNTALSKYKRKREELAWVLSIGGDDLRLKLREDRAKKTQDAEAINSATSKYESPQLATISDYQKMTNKKIKP